MPGRPRLGYPAAKRSEETPEEAEVRIALVADVHANREAFAAVLAQIERARPDRIAVLGDIVGYGADPEWCVETAERLAGAGALVLLGNHDEAAVRADARGMNDMAAAAIRWTSERLKPSHKAFLGNLPYTHEEGEVLYVHASAHGPRNWNYVLERRDAELSFRATAMRVTIAGHTHIPALFNVGPSGMAERFRPVDGSAVPLLRQRRWLAVVGATGQPRDGNAAAAYAVLDTKAGTYTTHRAPYDVDTAAAKIRRAGLPETLARRLFAGR